MNQTHQKSQFNTPKRKKISNDNTPLNSSDDSFYRLHTKSKRKPKKSIKNETRAVRAERKEKRNLGLEYTTKMGKVMRQRKCQSLGKCRLECQKRIDEEKRQKLFCDYWQMASFNKRVAFIAGLIKTEPKKCSKRKIQNISKQKNRLVTHTYLLPINHDRLQVCKHCFLKTFDESNRFLTNVIKNRQTSDSGICHDDRRGLSAPANKTLDSDIKLVHTHINLIPTYESHYCRKRTAKRYLPHYYTLSRIYEENEPFQILNFLRKGTTWPQKINIPATYKGPNPISMEKKGNLIDMLPYIDKAFHAFYKSLDKDEYFVTKIVEFFLNMMFFDLYRFPQIYLPISNESAIFYKSRLLNFNFTFYDLASRECFCFVWNETISRRGSSKISTCLFKVLEEYSRKGIKQVELFSDVCFGQNKNTFITAMLLYALDKFPSLEQIPMRYFETNHGQNEGDAAHSAISTAISTAEDIFPCTSRSSLLQYTEDSDDSYKDPNYCPSSDISNNEDHVRDENAVLGQKKECRMYRKKTQKFTKWTKHPKAIKSRCAPCRKKCSEIIPEGTRQDIFNEYWKEKKHWDLKRQFIRSHVESKPIVCRRPRDNSKNSKTQTTKYFFEIPFKHATKKVDVCKTYFSNTFRISETVVRNDLKK
nr:unnamed protein product [Callosobruchus chinensis]